MLVSKKLQKRKQVFLSTRIPAMFKMAGAGITMIDPATHYWGIVCTNGDLQVGCGMNI